MKLITFTLAFFFTIASFGQIDKFDLAVKNAKVFDSKKGTLASNQTILIKDGNTSSPGCHQDFTLCRFNDIVDIIFWQGCFYTIDMTDSPDVISVRIKNADSPVRAQPDIVLVILKY